MSHHLIRRGVNRCAIVLDDEDRDAALDAFRLASVVADVAVHGYCLMDNHYHALVTPTAPGALSHMLKKFGETFVRHINDKHGRIGTLWTGRFRAPLIQDERRWLTCLRYVEENPVRAGMVARPEAYRWSSYRYHACGAPNEWIVPHPLYLALGRTPAERQAAYRAISARA